MRRAMPAFFEAYGSAARSRRAGKANCEMRFPSQHEPAGRCIDHGHIDIAASGAGFKLDLGHIANWILIGDGALVVIGGMFYLG